jgi:hypothetical protein
MIRFKILITFVLLTLVVGGVGYATHQRAAGAALEADADASLRRSEAIAQLEIRTIEHSMANKASAIAQQPDLIKAVTADYSEHEDPVGDRYYEVGIAITSRDNELKDYTAGPGKGVPASDAPLYNRLGKPDLFFAVDNKGIGLAAVGPDLLRWRGTDVSKAYPIIAEAMTKNDVRTSIMHFSYDAKVEGSLYILAIAPIRASVADMPSGAVVVGYQISDGLAKRLQRLAAGVPDGADDSADTARLMRSAPQIAVFYDKTFVGSTFDTAKRGSVAQDLLATQDMVAKEGVEKATRTEIDGEPFFARARLLSGHTDDKTPVGVIALTSVEQATAPLANPGSTTLLITLIIALIGAALSYVFLHLYLREFEKLEQTIQEIIAGNKDAVFSAGASNELATGLAQQLNLMSAYLQGKPMPDDDEGGPGAAGGTWGGEVGGGHKAVQGVNLGALMNKKPSDNNEPPKEG